MHCKIHHEKKHGWDRFMEPVVCFVMGLAESDIQGTVRFSPCFSGSGSSLWVPAWGLGSP